MRLLDERKKIVQHCQLLLKSGLTKGTGGNISIYVPSENCVVISPSGVPYDSMEPEDVVLIDLDGNKIEGNYKPSSEWAMHTAVYKQKPEMQAVVHTHSVFAKTLSCLREDLPAVSYLVAVAGKKVSCAQYASFGTQELADNALTAMGDSKAVLLANHGLLAAGETIEEAFNIAEEIELCAEVYIRARGIGKPVILDDDEMEYMLERFKTYGARHTNNSHTI
ncbi:L-fuculose-phosphate aldolase [Metasolibacillus sp. FSL H7-0170]|uniref:L-fuculose-phosphate aldolase n=1 Tax=Metasolibacillus TaxID=2703677 RepID=UPI0007960D23|nr:L-fuculose-phosphate aldolase [Metasolibacillus fluoroglycofenilyticus]KYG89237.1 fuculose phosphate aldolase [[Bacillus] sp. KCTC 13219]